LYSIKRRTLLDDSMSVFSLFFFFFFHSFSSRNLVRLFSSSHEIFEIEKDSRQKLMGERDINEISTIMELQTAEGRVFIVMSHSTNDHEIKLSFSATDRYPHRIGAVPKERWRQSLFYIPQGG